MVFSAGGRILAKLLRQEKRVCCWMFITEFPSKPWTKHVSGLNKRLLILDTSYFGVIAQKLL